MIKAVLFDLDGVLVNSERVNIAAGVCAFKDIGIKLKASDKKLIIGRHPADYDKVFRYKFDRKDIVKRHRKYYDRFYHLTTPFRYAGEFVREVKRRGFKIGLVTSCNRSTVGRALRIVNLNGAFDALITFEKCRKRKPSPEPYLTAARHLGMRPSECVVVEDSIPEVEAAKRARMKCIAVTNSFPASKLKKADLIVKRLNDDRIWKVLC